MMKIRENACVIDPNKRYQVRPVSLNLRNLSSMFNGIDDETVLERPYLRTFNENSIIMFWGNDEFVPFTRKCFENMKVEHALDESVPNQHSLRLEEL